MPPPVAELQADFTEAEFLSQDTSTSCCSDLQLGLTALPSRKLRREAILPQLPGHAEGWGNREGRTQFSGVRGREMSPLGHPPACARAQWSQGLARNQSGHDREHFRQSLSPDETEAATVSPQPLLYSQTSI